MGGVCGAPGGLTLACVCASEQPATPAPTTTRSQTCAKATRRSEQRELSRFKEHSASIAELRDLHLRILRRVIVRGDRGDCGLEMTRWPVSAATHAAAVSADAAFLAPEGGSLLTALITLSFLCYNADQSRRRSRLCVQDCCVTSSSKVGALLSSVRPAPFLDAESGRCVDDPRGSPLEPAMFKNLQLSTNQCPILQEI